MNMLIIGGSRGLGHALAKGLQPITNQLFILSRSQPQVLQQDPAFPASWIQADLVTPAFLPILQETLRDTPLDVLIYNAGIWESNAFSPAYEFATTTAAQMSELIQINLTSAILAVQALLPNLSLVPSAQIILIGSSSGLDNNQSRAVAYQASKFGLRGLNNALRENLRGTTIRSTLLNLGDLSTLIPYEGGSRSRTAGGGLWLSACSGCGLSGGVFVSALTGELDQRGRPAGHHGPGGVKRGGLSATAGIEPFGQYVFANTLPNVRNRNSQNVCFLKSGIYGDGILKQYKQEIIS